MWMIKFEFETILSYERLKKKMTAFTIGLKVILKLIKSHCHIKTHSPHVFNHSTSILMVWKLCLKYEIKY